MRDAYQELGSAIVVQGIKDYLLYAKMVVKLSIIYLTKEETGKGNRLITSFSDSRQSYLECRHFLLSEWYEMLSDTNGRAVKEKLDAKVREYGNKRLFNETHKVISKD